MLRAFIVGMMGVTLLRAGENADAATAYPFLEPQLALIEEGSWEESASRAFLLLEERMKEVMGKDRTQYDEEKIAKLMPGWLKEFESKIPHRIWPEAKVEGRMPMPALLANNGRGLNCGVDELFAVIIMAQDQTSYMNMLCYAWIWQSFYNAQPAMAFEYLAKRAEKAEVTSIDIIHLYAALNYWPGSNSDLHGKPARKDWEKLYASKNPCYRLIALDKFDAVKQTPKDTMALYRECLFGACTYLEERALYAINYKKEYSPEMAALLREYINSKPLPDDGTKPKLRTNFPNLVEGAERLIKAMEKP